MRFRFPAIFWIVLFAFLIRLVFLLKVPPPQIHPGSDDAILYHQTGLQLREYFQKAGPLLKEFSGGHLFKGGHLLDQYGLEIPWGAFARGPVYPLFLALLFWMFGSDPLPVFMAQALLISLSCGLIYGIGKELGQPRVGLVGAFVVGVYPPFVFIVSRLFQESLAIFLFSLFYFLAFRCQKKGSVWLFSATGVALFFLSLSRSAQAYFPFFLFAGIVLLGGFLKRKLFPRRSWVLILSFLVPYGIWASVASWQLRRPAIVGEPIGPIILSALFPDYDGWVPDTFQGSRPDRKAAEVLKGEGILEALPEGTLEWPSQPKMVFAALGLLWKYPGFSLRLAVEKFRRLWWQPFDWPWREFLFPPGPLRWFHQTLVVAALLGGLLWIFERPLPLSFLLAPALYGTLTHSLFHIESRYGMIFLAFMPLMAGFFFLFVWRNRNILFTPLRKVMIGFIAILTGGTAFHLSHPPFLLTVLPSLETPWVHLLGVGIRSILLAGLFVIFVFWLRPVLSRKCLLTCLLVSALAIFIPFEVHALSPQYGPEWEALIPNPTEGVRQEIFLPRGSLVDSLRQNLRLDLELPRKGSVWGIWVNGERIGTLEKLKERLPLDLLIPPYRVYLQDMRKEPFQVRQWFVLPLPSHILKEEDFNTVDIRAEGKDLPQTLPSAQRWKIFGDYPFTFSERIFFGPLFHHSAAEISVVKFQFDGDFRLRGRVPLHHRGARSSFFDGKKWQDRDLSSVPGIQRGEYRIRIEMERTSGEFLVY